MDAWPSGQRWVTPEALNADRKQRPSAPNPPPLSWFIFMCMCVVFLSVLVLFLFPLHVCLGTMCMPRACGSQKRDLNALLEL